MDNLLDIFALRLRFDDEWFLLYLKNYLFYTLTLNTIQKTIHTVSIGYNSRLYKIYNLSPNRS